VRRITSRLSGGEWLLLGLLAAWSLIPAAVALQHLIEHGGVWTGVDGGGVVDHFGYLAWIRESSEHVLMANRFDVDDDPAVYLQPQWAIGGLLTWATGSVQLGFLAFKPVAVAALFLGFRAYVRRTLDGRGERFAALALALFYWPVAAPVMSRAGLDTGIGAVELFGYEMGVTNFVWGYFQTGIAIGLMPVFLLCCEALLDPERRRAGRSARWYAVAAGAAGAMVSWAHPWQGITLLATLFAVALWDRRRALSMALAGPVAATIAPLVYFWALSKTDSVWREGSGEADPNHYWRWLALALLPIVLAALPGFLARRPLRDLGLQSRMLVAWPLVAVAIYAVADRTFYYHFVSGLTLPLAVLAVRGWRTLGDGRALRAAGVVGVIVCTVPGTLHVVERFRDDVQGGGLARYLEDGEADALRHLDDSPREGAVITRLYLGAAVPAYAGRHTYVGHASWTPDFVARVDETEALFGGRMPRARARELVRRTGAAFALSDCNERADLRPVLGDAIVGVRRFGCATVYELRE
jgi:hypothetical protein